MISLIISIIPLIIIIYYFIIIKSNVIKPILIPKLNNTLKSKTQTNSKIFSIINLEAITAKKIAINITDLKIITNSIICHSKNKYLCDTGM